MYSIKIFILPLLFYFFSGCTENESVKNSAYHASFETLNDTTGWKGIYPTMFVNEDGKNYVLLKSSLPEPAATMEINIAEEGNYKLECTGKTKLNGGYICLKNSPVLNSDAGCVYVNGNEWTKYSSNRIYCPANSQLVIEIFAGGDIPSDLYLDELSLTK
jgi:hypothetical protein